MLSTMVNKAGQRPEVFERQLAHKERNQVRAVYHRSTYVAERTQLMQWWANYLDIRRMGQTLAMPQQVKA